MNTIDVKRERVTDDTGNGKWSALDSNGGIVRIRVRGKSRAWNHVNCHVNAP